MNFILWIECKSYTNIGWNKRGGNKATKISSKSLEILKICLTKHNPDLLNVIRDDYNSEFDNLHNDLREAVCDELVINELKDGKVSEYGIELENLIGEIGRLFM